MCGVLGWAWQQSEVRGGTAHCGDYRLGLLPLLLGHGPAGVTCVGTGCGHFRCGLGHVEALLGLFCLAQIDQGSQRDSITEVKHVKACIQTNKHVRTQTNPMRRVGVFFVSFGCQCVDVCQFSLVEEKG